jgi:hypothetical protein
MAYSERLEIRSVGEKIFGDTSIAMLFGVGISGAVVEIGKAVFFLYLRGKLRNSCHDRYKKITGFEKFTAHIFSMCACQGDLQSWSGVFFVSIAQKTITAQYGKTTDNIRYLPRLGK